MTRMERYSVFVPKLLPAAEAFIPEAGSCPGCGQALAVRLIGKAIGHHSRFPYGGAVAGVPASALPSSRWKVFPCHPVRASRPRGSAGKPAAVAGESGTFQDMLPVLREAARGKNKLFYICFFNEAGIQRRHGAPDAGSRPDPTQNFLQRLEHLHGVLDAVRALRPDFMATACPGYPHDLIAKVQQGLDCPGTAFLGVLAPCPTGCFYDPSLSLRAGRLAVRTGFFPLYTVARGSLSINRPPREDCCAVTDYLKLHHAYIYMHRDEVAQVQDRVAQRLERLTGAQQ